MEKYIGLLVSASTLAGAIWIVLAACWLLSKKRLTSFRKLTLAFMCAGAGVPVVLLPIWNWINSHASLQAQIRIEDVALTLWPTSIELLALDSPGPVPWGTIAFVYGFSILGNVGAYGLVGLLVGLSYGYLSRKASV